MSYEPVIASIPPVWNKPLPTYAGLSGFGAAAPQKPVSLETALAMYQVDVAKMVGKVVSSISKLSIMSRPAAIEWGTRMNDVAAQVMTSLNKKGANGLPFWKNHPQKALKLLADNAQFMAEESKDYEAAGKHLLSISANLQQAGEVIVEHGSKVVEKGFKAGLKGAAAGSPAVVIGVALLAAVWIYGQVK